MLLYFPSLNISRSDIIPGTYEETYILYLKSKINSPKHYPEHSLIDGKIELVGKFQSSDDFNFWSNFLFNTNKTSSLKGKQISSLIEFNEHDSVKLKLVGIGKKDENSFFFWNKSLAFNPEETMAKLNYEVIPKIQKDKIKIKI